ncbi:hypothetical protein WR25_18187 [Diploscapter pachys]|uniref:Uncharacterized protein n=1 Tax=Diploscapter pachys TaxID=2018661 RepID=A0A2A2JHV5_9BILA|nr:hypothetical protein WR25_18187 [Diploscapter pachys]
MNFLGSNAFAFILSISIATLLTINYIYNKSPSSIAFFSSIDYKVYAPPRAYVVMGADTNHIYLFPLIVTIRNWKRNNVNSILCFAEPRENFMRDEATRFIFETIIAEEGVSVSKDWLADGDVLARRLYEEFDDVEFIRNGTGKPKISESWYADQMIVSERIADWIKRDGNEKYLGRYQWFGRAKRLDRAWWKNDFSKVDLSKFHDVHILHPLGEPNNWKRTLSLLKKMFDESDVEWLERIHEEYARIVVFPPQTTPSPRPIKRRFGMLPMASTGFTVNRLPPLDNPLQYDYAPEEPEQEINRRENYRKNQRRTITRKQQEVRAERDRGRSKERRMTGRNRSKSGSRSRQTAEAEESRQRRRSQSRTREWVEDTSEVDYHNRGVAQSFVDNQAPITGYQANDSFNSLDNPLSASQYPWISNGYHPDWHLRILRVLNDSGYSQPAADNSTPANGDFPRYLSRMY